MAFDGTFLFKLNQEFECLAGARTDKIHQPSKDVLVLFLRGKPRNCRLIINLSANPRIYLSKSSPENPETPPRFCTVLRKYLTGARILSFQAEDFERVLKIKFETFNEMGDIIEYTLVLELISAVSNAVLVDKDGKIVDSLRRSDIEKDERIIHTGAHYQPPKPMEKLNPLATDVKTLTNSVMEKGGELWKAILETIAGISPSTAREIALKITENPTERVENIPYLNIYIEKALSDFKNSLKEKPVPTAVIKDNKAVDFSWFRPEGSFGEAELKTYGSLSELLEEYYKEKEAKEQIASKSAELNKTLANLRARLSRKLLARQKDFEKSERAEEYRIKGELIKANLYQIARGLPFVDLPNYYSETGEEIRIVLDPALSPSDNSARYFKEYKKLMSARGMLDRLILDCKKEIEYIESVQEALSRAASSVDLDMIRFELAESGYIREKTGKKKKLIPQKPIKLISPAGFQILVGRNNMENDKLSLSVADKNDIWFHTKDVHGSHVIVKTEGKEPDNETLTIAAETAAYNSKARASSQVPVDMTLARYVKKPSGAKPGMVIYTNQTTLFVTPKNHL